MRLPDKQQEAQIENIVHVRFYDRTSVYNVYRWLENFEDDEMDNAIDILEHIMYFRESDIINMLNDTLKMLLDGWNMKDSVLYILPLGEPGKSADAMMYYAHKTLNQEIKRYKDSIKFVNYTSEIDSELCNAKENVYVIMLDDIIGSGGSFEEAVTDNNGNIREDWVPILGNKHFKTILVAPVMLESGKNRIAKKFPNVEIMSKETYHKAFEKGQSVIGGYVPLLRLREFCYKCGVLLDANNPLGWKNSQALVVFDHATPNNTLPIIWSNKYVKPLNRNWFPLFPRSYNVVGNRSYSERNDNNRWISMLVDSLYKDKFEEMPFDERRKSLKKYFTKDNYNLLLLFRMKIAKEPDFRIANTLAITANDLESLYKQGVGELWDENHVVTPEARKAYEEVEKLIRIERTHTNWKRPRKVVDKDHVYIPGTFKGLK